MYTHGWNEQSILLFFDFRNWPVSCQISTYGVIKFDTLKVKLLRQNCSLTWVKCGTNLNLVLWKGDLMHLRKISTHVSLRSPRRLTWAETFRSLQILGMQKLPFFLRVNRLFDNITIFIDPVTGDHSFKHGCFSIEIQYLRTVLEGILFRSVVMVLVFRPGIPGSSPVQFLYFYHTLIHFFLCNGLCS